MNKKGFTLIELLGVMIVLAIIAVITVPIVNTVTRASRESTYNKQISTLESAAKKWGVENDNKLPDIGSTSIITIDFDTLINDGYLKNEKIINPKTEEELTGCIKVSYNNEFNQYEYIYTDNLTDCASYNVNNL